ncbi:sigma 54-interacting transcriptional regulator [Sodalis sp. RH21]|uniref:sigma 54-interacting transcriptional regulator n=1 Tax=unclassified Sodalis (in: enterobacteria) TaxID=2636512 RepID=UPI0039B44F3F
MKRIDKIYAWMSEQFEPFTRNELRERGGFTTQDIAEALAILRNNVSFELNNLLRLGLIIKIRGRPVRYLPKAGIERLLAIKLGEPCGEFADLAALLNPASLPAAPVDEKPVAVRDKNNPFSMLIGADSSLKNLVEQAKAAVLYPPSGLHTLITGQTGVGKSLFASMMFNYARYVGRFAPGTPFIVFNCADYAMNPQLLMAHLFGYVKGAFTGAGADKEGLIQKADGGMLFLDEIHRLPPEGQEMVFYFMDSGTYSRLGETERGQTASVLLVGATTEDPKSSLLQTFVRRIPIIIDIPTFEQRSAKEKIELLKFLLVKEAHRIQKPIRIDAEAMKALIGNTAFGNIGQMKSNVQLVCANGFLHCLHQDTVSIAFRDLPGEVKNGFFYLSGRRSEMQQITDRLENELVVGPQDDSRSLQEDDQYEPSFNLYNVIEGKVGFMQERGMSHDEIVRFITLDISIHLNSFYLKFQNGNRLQENILKLVNEDILGFAQTMRVLVERELNQRLTERFLLAFSLHLTSFLERVNNHYPLAYPNIDNAVNNHAVEYAVALKLKTAIEEKFAVTVPDMEIIYLTLLIGSLLKTQQEERVAVLVAMHGSGTAGSMANVAQKLLGEGVIDSIDMPLDLSPKLVLDQMRQRIKDLNQGKGVLLLVDMGSLSGFGDIIMQETGIPVRTLTMVSTPTVIEAVRKSAGMDMDLDDIYFSLCDFKGYGNYQKTAQQQDTSGLLQKVEAILSVCSTGQGTAEKLKIFVDGMLQGMGRGDINVIAMSLGEIEQQRATLMGRYRFIMALGIADPRIGAPYLTLEQLFSSDGEAQFTRLVQHYPVTAPAVKPHAMVRKISEESMNEFITYLNPHKIVEPILEFISLLETLERRSFDNGMKISLSVHIASALERMIRNTGLVYQGRLADVQQQRLQAYRQAASCFEKKLALTLDDSELAYLLEIVTELSNRRCVPEDNDL